ncbi:MAG: sulfotransferase [Parvularculaceae bacterium]|nr:sulfotransferase [Parvularculaceae bacterium]
MNHRLLICIGTQKAGTTWLSDYMRARPDVHAPPVKEVHYFDARFAPQWCARYEDEMLADFKREVEALTLSSAADTAMQTKLAAMLLRFRMVTSPADYMRFMRWGAGAQRILFEATPDYVMLDRRGFAAMKAANDDVRLILLLRNPADRFWSSLRFNKTHRPDFDIDTMFDKLIAREDFRLLADYERTIREAQAALGPDRLHIEFYERLFTEAALKRLCDFAGLPYAPGDFTERSNASSPLSMPAAKRAAAVAAYRHVYTAMVARFAGDLPATWLADLDLKEN